MGVKMKKIFFALICCLLLLTNLAGADVTLTIKPIAKNGDISENAVDISELSQSVPSSVSIEILPETEICTGKDGKIIDCPESQATPKPKKITAQIYPGAQLFVSSDSQNIMQITDVPGYPQLEIYYEYSQEDPNTPWKDYIRVENDFIVHGNFATRSVWITPINQTIVQGVIDSQTIPVLGELL